MKDRNDAGLNQNTRMEQPVIAVILACGRPPPVAEFQNIKYKAQLTFNGRPIVSYVSDALCNAQVEKVFIVCESAQGLEKLPGSCEKMVFVKCEASQPTMADSAISCLENILDYYGEEQLGQRKIMFVPCDIPLVSGQDFDGLIEQTVNCDADYIIALIKNTLLRRELPERHFRKLRLNELGGDYCFLPVVFVNGGIIRRPEKTGGLYRVTVRGHRGSSLEELLEKVDAVRKRRHNILGWARFGYEVAGKGSKVLFFRLLAGLLRKRVTESVFIQAVYQTIGMKLAVIQSTSAVFSADVDTPSDLEYFSKLSLPRMERAGVESHFGGAAASSGVDGT